MHSMVLAVVSALTFQANLSSPDDFLRRVQAAARQGLAETAALFRDPQDARYLRQIAGGRTAGLDVRMIPAPPGWKNVGSYWLVFSRVQDIESEYDAVYRVNQTSGGLTIGAEIEEAEASKSASIIGSVAKVRLDPPHRSVAVTTHLSLRNQGGRALVFRLNLPYHLDQPDVIVAGDKVPQPKAGSWVRAGGLLVKWDTRTTTAVDLAYSGVPGGEDRVGDKVAYVTAWWIPSIGRLPHTSKVSIEAPKDWVVRSEGIEVKPRSYDCTIPISFPKVVAGRFELAAERKDAKGRVFRSWQFAPLDRKRAEFDVKRMAEMAEFYDEKLTPWPFPGYECFDGIGYYGIESYSYTILAPSISSRYVGHEMGHTYFGGLAPCAYVKDTWNEGVTTYVDDVLTGRNIDQPLEQALRNAETIHTPLSQMSLAWGEGDESYWRGAYVMKMLEAEIGAPKVLEGLRRLIKGQVGKETTWDSLRPYFEAAGGKQLDWFWRQWIDGGTFPTVEIVSASQSSAPTADSKQATLVTIKLKQSGTAPFRIRIPVVATNGELEYASEVILDRAEAIVEIKCETPVRHIVLRPLGYTLSKAGASVEVARP